MSVCLCQLILYLALFVLSSMWWIPNYSGTTLTDTVGPDKLMFFGGLPRPTPLTGSECFFQSPNANTTGVRVIVPALPKSGSTSLQKALMELGLRVYKAEDVFFYMLPVVSSEGFGEELMADDTKVPSLVAGLQGCKVDVIFPDGFDYLIDWKRLYKASPGAKVILTVRPWKASQQSFVRFFKFLAARNTCGCIMLGSFRMFPWHRLLHYLDFGLAELKQEGGPEIMRKSTLLVQLWYYTYVVPNYWRFFYKFVWPFAVNVVDNEEAFNAHNEDVKRTVPPEDLLVFQVGKHGWEELTDFLGVASVPQKPFPKSRSAKAFSPDTVAEDVEDIKAGVCAMGLILHIVNFLIVRGAWNAAARACGYGGRLKTKEQ